MDSKIDQKKLTGNAVDIIVFGVVQGVGFRPFIYRLAKEHNYKGWVNNIGFGVKIHLESEEKTDFNKFLKAFDNQKPPLSQIEKIDIQPSSYSGYKDFRIEKSKQGKSFVFISPDISLCENCLQEMMTTSDRRYLYAFINCTDCGPRYTIVKSLPYDRKQTTMKDFAMCESCHKEYTNPLDRRYHAQPIACPICGPHIRLIEAKTGREMKGGMKRASRLIKDGKILAVKGLGGFHLICDAVNYGAVQRLRKIKERKMKPLALMAHDLSVIKKLAEVDPAEEKQLLAARRPIVLLNKKKDIRGIAPHLNELGFMLPYTPIHYLLMNDLDLIVATSSNKKDSPIIKDENEGIQGLCDYVLTHNRPIYMRTDDSLMKIVDGEALFLRRARGYVPYPQGVPEGLKSSQHVLALGAELKNTVSIYKNGYVITSQFLGDLDEYQNFKYFEETIQHLTHLFEVKPDILVSDLHPHFLTTRYAQKLGIPHLQVQHHFAHVLAPLLEHKIQPHKKVLGIAFDGYGYGQDGSAWGGEFLIADYSGYRRFAQFKNIPLPGGDLAARQPWRMTISYLIHTYGVNFPKVQSLDKISISKIKGVIEMIRRKINSPLTSSCGRLFDAVSFLVGLSPPQVEFEAEAPMRLESVALIGIEENYGFSIIQASPSQVDFSQTIKEIIKDLDQGVPISQISSKFHNTLARVVIKIAEKARKEQNIDTVVLTGGVFLNKVLLLATKKLLEKAGFTVLRPMNYSPNDESISVGQIAYALNILKSGQLNYS